MSSYNKSFNQAVELLPKYVEIREFGYTNLIDYLDLLTSIMPITFAYNHRMYDENMQYIFFHDWFPREKQTEDEYRRFSSSITRCRFVFENYNHNNDLMWTVLAYLWENYIGDEYTLSVYERECMNDDEYIKIGKAIKSVLKR